MAEQAGPDGSMWVVEPPDASQVHLSIGMGEGVTITPEVRARLEGFLASFFSGEGLAAEDPVKCGGVYQRCNPFTCTLDACKPLKSAPCLQLISCRIDT